MKLHIQIQNVNGGDLTSKCSIGNLNVELEADLTAWDRMTSADEQRRFIDNALHVIDYHNTKPEAVKTYIKAVVGGIASGVIESVDESINPATRLRRKIMRWLDAINPVKLWEKSRHREDCDCRCNSKDVADGFKRDRRPSVPEDDSVFVSSLASSFSGKED